jgi:SpoVK/Ycf46/Vps4 family AAA+-type ATPase
VKKEGKPWGFEAVAGMESLKEELKDSFIKPLRFKFLIEKLKREEALQAELPEDQKLEKKMDILPSEKKKHELMSRLYTEYEKYKISIPTGMLFYGPPGTGKTFVTKKLAEELGCGFVSKNL